MHFTSVVEGIADILALKHVSRIFGHCNDPALLVSQFQANTEHTTYSARGGTTKNDTIAD